MPAIHAVQENGRKERFIPLARSDQCGQNVINAQTTWFGYTFLFLFWFRMTHILYSNENIRSVIALAHGSILSLIDRKQIYIITSSHLNGWSCSDYCGITLSKNQRSLFTFYQSWSELSAISFPWCEVKTWKTISTLMLAACDQHGCISQRLSQYLLSLMSAHNKWKCLHCH